MRKLIVSLSISLRFLIRDMRIDSGIIDKTVTLVLPKIDKTNISLRADKGIVRNFVIGTIISDYSATSVKRKVRGFIKQANRVDDKDIVLHKVQNKELEIELLSSRISIQYNNDSNPCYWFHGINYSTTSIIGIRSPELDSMFPGYHIGLFVNSAKLLNLLIMAGASEDNIIRGKFYVNSWGQAISNFQVGFQPWHSLLRGNRYGKLLKESKYTSHKDLKPGRLYSYSRSSSSNLFLYLGEVSRDCFMRGDYSIKKYIPIDWTDNYFLCWHSQNIHRPSNPTLSCVLEISNFDFDDAGKLRDTLIGSDIVSKMINSKDHDFKFRNLRLGVDFRGIELEDFNLEGIKDSSDFIRKLELAVENELLDKNNTLSHSDSSLAVLTSLCPDLIYNDKELRLKLIELSFSGIKFSSGRDSTLSFLASNTNIKEEELKSVMSKLPKPSFD